MIYGLEAQPIQQTLHYRFQTITEWALPRLDMLFAPKREPNFSLNVIIHFFMNRLGQQYKDILLMDEETRDELFDMEYQVFLKEQSKQSL